MSESEKKLRNVVFGTFGDEFFLLVKSNKNLTFYSFEKEFETSFARKIITVIRAMRTKRIARTWSMLT